MRHAGQEMIRGCDKNILEYLLLVHTVGLASLAVRCSVLPKDDMLRIETFLLFDCSSLVAKFTAKFPEGVNSCIWVQTSHQDSFCGQHWFAPLPSRSGMCSIHTVWSHGGGERVWPGSASGKCITMYVVEIGVCRVA
jgi:hypothetical protein